jgi:hypothetical protein
VSKSVRLFYLMGHPQMRKPCEVTVARRGESLVISRRGLLGKSISIPVAAVCGSRIANLGDLDRQRTAGLIMGASFLAGPFAGMLAAQGAANQPAIILSFTQGTVALDMVFRPLKKLDQDYSRLAKLLAG